MEEAPGGEKRVPCSEAPLGLFAERLVNCLRTKPNGNERKREREREKNIE